MSQTFSTRQVAELSRASVRQIDYWARTGLLKPSGREASGRGTRRRYSFLDVVAILTIRNLRQHGCPLGKIRAAVKELRKQDPTLADGGRLSRLTLLTDGRQVYLLTDQQQVMEVVTRQNVWSVPLGLLIRQARDAADRLPAEWTETVRVDARDYHLVLTPDPEAGGYVVQCRELPGALEQGETAEQAIANGKAAIESVLSFLARKRGDRRGARRVQAG